MEGGVVLQDEDHAYFALNETGELLWSTLTARAASAEELVALLLDTFEIEPATARADVDAWLAALERGRLIVRE
jgi:hypothetical protein